MLIDLKRRAGHIVEGPTRKHQGSQDMEKLYARGFLVVSMRRKRKNGISNFRIFYLEQLQQLWDIRAVLSFLVTRPVVIKTGV